MSVKNYFRKVLYTTLMMGLLLFLIVAAIMATVNWYLIPQLPSTEHLKDVNLQAPFLVYTRDKRFITGYGKRRRIPLPLEQIPPLLVKAVLASEDETFFEHKGVEAKSLFRAVFNLLITGQKRQGGSTITMQVTRNFLLTRKRTFTRKFQEIYLSLKIEKELSKKEILALYLNKIYLGYRSYGFGAAAQVYYGKDLRDLSLAQWAMMAGLPKAPSANNPLKNPKRALERRGYVLARMLKLNYITQKEYDKAMKERIKAKQHQPGSDFDGFYIADMVRAYMISKFGKDAYKGYKVYTTIDSRLQRRAQSIIRRKVGGFDRARGYRGPLAHVSIPRNIKKKDDIYKWADGALKRYPLEVGGTMPSIVLSIGRKRLTVYNRMVGVVRIYGSNVRWARSYIVRRGRYKRRKYLRKGDIIWAKPHLRKRKGKKEDPDSIYEVSFSRKTKVKRLKRAGWSVFQNPEFQGSIVAVKPTDGAVLALVGGYNFHHSKFNRGSYARRQPGSTFKPFTYSAAIKKGYSASSRIYDGRIVFKVGGTYWIPKNYSHRYYGWTTLRRALTYSFNVSAVRLLKQVGLDYTLEHLKKFGFNRVPRNYTIALGSSEVTVLELTSGFTVFANGGYRVKPYLIDRIEDYSGKVVYTAHPFKICRKCSKDVLATLEELNASDIVVPNQSCSLVPRYAPRVISKRNVRNMTSMMRSVVNRGTGKRARFLGHGLAGKTGTTSNQRDVWFAAYTSKLAASVWLGYDRPRKIYKAAGGKTAAPVLARFLRTALNSRIVNSYSRPVPTEVEKIREYDYSNIADNPNSVSSAKEITETATTGTRALFVPNSPRSDYFYNKKRKTTKKEKVKTKSKAKTKKKRRSKRKRKRKPRRKRNNR